MSPRRRLVVAALPLGELGVRLDDGVQLADLVAVGLTRLAWRDGPVERWHGRIANPEMMRANAATTRLVRDFLRERLGALSSATGDVLASACELIADTDRCLPDGRHVRQFAPSAEELIAFERHVHTVGERSAALAREVGGSEAVGLVACFAAAHCWRWWSTPTWPHRVAEFSRRLQEPSRWADEHMADEVRRLVAQASCDIDYERLGEVLLAGPDKLDTASIAFCLAAGLHSVLPQHCGLRPVFHRALTWEQMELIGGLTPAPAS